MTTFTSISNASVAVGAIPSSTTVTALRDNPLAIAEGSSGAPVMVSGWHPVDKVTIGDGKTGLIYDSAVNGTLANVTTANFEDGWEYRIVALDMQHNSGTTQRFQVNAYFQTNAVYRRVWYTPANNSSNYFGCDIHFILPRVASRGHMMQTVGFTEPTYFGNDYIENFYDSTVQKILNVRFNFTAGSISGGKIYVFRRRDYASSP